MKKYLEKNINLLQVKKDYPEEESTKLSTKSPSPAQSTSNGVEQFKMKYREKNFLSSFLDKNCPSFSEDFELTKFISCGGTGVVYEGQILQK